MNQLGCLHARHYQARWLNRLLRRLLPTWQLAPVSSRDGALDYVQSFPGRRRGLFSYAQPNHELNSSSPARPHNLTFSSATLPRGSAWRRCLAATHQCVPFCRRFQVSMLLLLRACVRAQIPCTSSCAASALTWWCQQWRRGLKEEQGCVQRGATAESSQTLAPLQGC